MATISQDLFEMSSRAYLVTVDHYSDYYAVVQLPTTQSMAVIQATKQRFGCHSVPHTFVTDDAQEYTSDLFKVFTQKYKFNHITSSLY